MHHRYFARSIHIQVANGIQPYSVTVSTIECEDSAKSFTRRLFVYRRDLTESKAKSISVGKTEIRFLVGFQVEREILKPQAIDVSMSYLRINIKL